MVVGSTVQLLFCVDAGDYTCLDFCTLHLIGIGEYMLLFRTRIGKYMPRFCALLHICISYICITWHALVLSIR